MRVLIHNHIDEDLGIEVCVYLHGGATRSTATAKKISMDLSKFESRRDIYTSSEIAARVLDKPIEKVTLDDMKQVVTSLLPQGSIKVLNEGKQVRWPGYGKFWSPLRVYAVRNAELYSDVGKIKKHLLGTRYPTPSAWATKSS